MGYHAPEKLAEAFAILEGEGARPIAGGTDWFPAQGEGVSPTPLLDVTRLPGFRGIARDGAAWRIGAASTWAEVTAAPLPPAFDGLKAAAREVGSIQIQNAGTVAGNLCNASPAADGLPPLLTLGAEVELVSRLGTRRLPVGDFVTGVRRTALAPGELVSAVLVPDPPEGAGSAFLKLGARRYLVISIASVAVLVRRDGGRILEARVAVGSCSPVAQRLPGLETRLAGHDLARPIPAPAGDDLSPLSPIGDVRGSAAYRLEAAGELIGRALARAAGG